MKKTCYKFIYIILIIAISLNTCVFAVSGEEAVLDAQFLTSTGITMSGTDGSKWLAEYQAERLVMNLLENNYGFVAESNRVWAKNKVTSMSKKVIMNNDYTFMIPSDFAKSVFGVSASGDYVSSETIEKSTGMKTFCDPRGFLLIGEASSMKVNDTPGSGCTYYIDYYTVSDAMGKITWQNKEMTDDERMAYIKRWQELMTFPQGEDSEEIRKFISTAYNSAKNVQKNVSLGAEGDGPFSDLVLKDLDTGSGTYKNNLLTAFSRIETMAVGYFADGKRDSGLREDILGCIEYLYKWYYTLQYKLWGENSSTWTAYQFNIPFAFGNALALMYDEISTEDMKKYTDSIFDHAPDPTVRVGGRQYGAEYCTNRAWKAFSFFNVAVLANDTLRMNYAMRYSNQIFEMNLSRKYDALSIPLDGFYDDGSMVFHNTVAYNLGYGSSYISLLAEMKVLTDGTAFDIENIYNYKNLYKFMQNNFLPFMEKSLTMKMVAGRHDVYGSSTILIPMGIIANYMPQAEKLKLTEAMILQFGTKRLKGFTSFPKGEFLESCVGFEKYREFVAYAENITPRENSGNSDAVYYNMDRAIHRNNNITAALSMSSSRIEKYECLSTSTNGKAWYTGDGMLCVYTDDTSQYTSSYFANVNPYYIPGTTVDSTPRKVIITSTAEQWGLPDNEWAGGVSNGTDSVLGMTLGNQYVTGLEGKKSYFMFGDRIVCMGSGIKGGKSDAYTVVDNRIISEENTTPVQDISLPIKKITDFRESTDTYLARLTDSNFSTNCAFEDLGGWFVFDFGEKIKIGTMAVAFNYGEQRKTKFDVLTSDNGTDFQQVTTIETGGKTSNFELLNIPLNTRYVKLIAQGNTNNNWFNLTDIKFFPSDVTRDSIDKSINSLVKGYNDVYINGKLQEAKFNTPETVENVNTLWLEDGMGYVFLDNANIETTREPTGPSTTFIHFAALHGNNPVDAKYAYVILPNRSLEETEEYYKTPDVEYIENSEACHIVKDLKTGIIGANLFRKGAVGKFEFLSPCSIMLDEKESKLYIADPTQKISELVINVSDGIKVKNNSYLKVKGNQITVDMTALGKGASYVIEYNSVVNNSNIRVRDYNIKCTDALVKTQLNAYSVNGEKLEYSIYAHPENGKAEIINDTLFYYPDALTLNESIVINVRSKGGDEAMFNVNLHRR